MTDFTPFHNAFAECVASITDDAREVLIDNAPDLPTAEQVLAQIMMSNLFAHDLDPDINRGQSINGINFLTPENKARLLAIATHMGPDYAQALYHIAVFMTKVA